MTRSKQVRQHPTGQSRKMARRATESPAQAPKGEICQRVRKATTEAPAREFKHLLTNHGVQQQAHADSNDTAQHAAGSGSTAWRENPHRATERPSRVPKGKSCPSDTRDPLRRPSEGIQARPRASRHCSKIPTRQRPQPPASQQGMTNIPAPRAPGRLQLHRPRNCRHQPHVIPELNLGTGKRDNSVDSTRSTLLLQSCAAHEIVGSKRNRSHREHALTTLHATTPSDRVGGKPTPIEPVVVGRTCSTGAHHPPASCRPGPPTPGVRLHANRRRARPPRGG